MSRLTRFKESASWNLRYWESRGVALAVGRSLMAAALLVSVLSTPDSGLFGDVNGFTDSERWTGISSISLWCVSDALTHGFLFGRYLSISVLVIVLSGYRPRWTCIPHWYVTFSFASSVIAPQGGDDAAMIATILLIPIFLGDDRSWQWAHPTSTISPSWRGSSLGAHLIMRLQIFTIYATGAISKLNDTAWRQGSALYLVAYDPVHGFPSSVRYLIAPLLSSYSVIPLLSWSVIAIEGSIALAMIGNRRIRWIGFSLTVLLHLAIGTLMGLPSFAAIMIGVVLIACGGRHVSASTSADLTLDGCIDERDESNESRI